MNLFKKLDNYLLHYYPSIWVTRVHYFLPIALGFMALVFLLNLAIGWNPKDAVPSGELLVTSLVIPVLIYLVYWFVFQARYNVLKSGGKMNLGLEYLNYFLYGFVFSTALFVVLVVPYSNDLKMANAVSSTEVLVDIENLNKGNSIVNYDGTFEKQSEGNYKVWEEDFVYNWRSNKGYSNDNEAELLSEREVLLRIQNYIESYNKYAKYNIQDSPQKVLSNRVNNDSYERYDNYSGYDWSVERKVRIIRDTHFGGGTNFWFDTEFWMSVSLTIAWLALVVWIFKQMNTRQFVYGLISICLTPLVVGILGLILFSMMSRSDDEAAVIGTTLILLAYVVVAAIVIRGYVQGRLNPSAYVLTMYLHFWISALPFFMYLAVLANRSRHYKWYTTKHEIMGMKEEHFVFWACIITCVISVAIFKPIYTRFRSLPLRK